jgi:hypothetical protein
MITGGRLVSGDGECGIAGLFGLEGDLEASHRRDRPACGYRFGFAKVSAGLRIRRLSSGASNEKL